MRSALISVASARAIRGAATPAPAAIIAELCRNRRLDRCFNMTATSLERSGDFAAPCYEMSECSFVGSAPRPRARPNGRRERPKASISRSGPGVVMERRLRSEGAEADHVFRPDGSGIVSSSPPLWVSERRTRLLSSGLYAYQLVR